MTPRLLIFTVIVVVKTVDFQGYHGAGEMGMGIRQVKIPQSSLLLPRLVFFFFS